MFRAFLLYLSRAGWANALITRFPLSRRMSRRFVAGETLDEAAAAARALNDDGLLVTLDLLGENVTTRTQAEAARDAAIAIVDRIAADGLQSGISIKLTQFGLVLNEDFCRQTVRELLAHAQDRGVFVRIDMEDSECTEATLAVFHALHPDFDNVGIVIQAYLYRSEADMRALVEVGANVRLCKGAYNEPPPVAFPDKADVDANYIKLMDIFLKEEARAKGAYLAVATHDDAMINAAKRHNLPEGAFEFQMLYGIRTGLQRELADAGHPVRVYVPYGDDWYPYFMRRLAERPANVWFLLRNVFRS